MVPGLVLVAGMGQRLAHGTSLAAIGPIALAGVAGYALEDSVDWIVALLLVGGAVLGAVLGAYLLNRLAARVLRYLFAGVLVVTAVRFLLTVPEELDRPDVTASMILALLLVGVASGTLAGLMGVGGGIIMVPAMVILFGMSDVVAKGTSLAVIVPTAVAATIQNVRNDNANLPMAAWLTAGGLAAAFLASLLAVRMDSRLSLTLFALLLIGVAVRLVVTAPEAGAS